MDLKALLYTLRVRPQLRKVAGNTSWLLVDKTVRLVVGLVVGVWLARYLGPESFGIYNFVFALVALAAPIASLGVEVLVVRDLVGRPDAPARILGTAFVMRLVSSAAALLVLLAATVLLRPEDPALVVLVLLASVTLLLQAFDVIDHWFQSRIESKYVVRARGFGFLVGTAVKIIFILAEVSLAWIVASSAIEFAVAALALLVVYRSLGNSLRAWRFDGRQGLVLAKQAWPLMVSALAIIGYMKIDIVMLSEMTDDRAVGVYSAATRISEAWYFIPTSLAASLFPLVVSWRKVEDALYRRRLQQIYALMVWTSAAAATVTTIVAEPLVLLLFGRAYAASADVLVIHIWASIAVFLGVATGQHLIAENLTRIMLYRTVIGLTVNVILNAALIPAYGPRGAAIATTISYAIAVFAIVFFRQTRNQGALLLKSFDPRVLFTIGSDLLRSPAVPTRAGSRGGPGHLAGGKYGR